LAQIRKAATTPKASGHEPARRILERDHFKLVYDRIPSEAALNAEAGKAIASALGEHYGSENVLQYAGGGGGGNVEFPGLRFDGTVESSLELSQTLKNLPPTKTDRVWIRPDLVSKARTWLTEERRKQIIQAASEREQE